MDTICAVATAKAAAAIGVIRVSGTDAISICDKIIKLKSGTLSEIKSSVMRMGMVLDKTQAVDEVLCVVFRAPGSYTSEDIVEINCHGGVDILNRVLKLLIKNGARYAMGGEFTKRAFLNGKMDLVQAEAVCDLINSHSAYDASLALSRMSGRLSCEFDRIFDALVSLNTDILAYIDFPDEGLSDVSPDTVLSSLQNVHERLIKLEKSFDTGCVIHDGVDTVIVGAPNVGKSTLLNAILGYERSIVSDIEGTTRDMVSERVVMGDVTLNLCDTAGIREKTEEIERRGIEIATRTLENSNLVFAVFDGSRKLNDNDKSIAGMCRKKTAIAVINKSDLPLKIDMEYINNNFIRIVHISAANNEGIEELSQKVAELFLADKVSIESGMLITNARHYERVCKARDYITSAIKTVQDGFTPDIASVDITSAASEIGMITGNSVSDKIIDEIFSKFCVGK